MRSIRRALWLIAALATLGHAQSNLPADVSERIRQGISAPWGLQQVVYAEVLSHQQRDALGTDLSAEQRRALEDAVNEVTALSQRFSTERALPAGRANVDFEFARAAAQVSTLAAARTTERGLAKVRQENMRALVVTAISSVAKGDSQAITDIAALLKDSSNPKYADVRASIQAEVMNQAAALRATARQQIYRMSCENLRLLILIDSDKAVDTGDVPCDGKDKATALAVWEKQARPKELLKLTDGVLSEVANQNIAELGAASTKAVENLATLTVGLQQQAADIAARARTLKSNADEVQAVVDEFQKKSRLWQLDPVEAVRTPSQFTSFMFARSAPGGKDWFQTGIATVLPPELNSRIKDIAAFASNKNLGFADLRQAGGTVVGVASLIHSIDPNFDASQVTVFVSAATSFINTASGLFNGGAVTSVFAALGTGGLAPMLGLLSGGGGVLSLFGGGGGGDSRVAQQLEQINQKLDAVIKLQRATLEAIADLSRQLQEATNTIVREIEAVSTQVTRLEEAHFKDRVDLARQPCKILFNDAVRLYGYDAGSGLMMTGNRFKFANYLIASSVPTGSGSFKNCRRFLDDLRFNNDPLPPSYLSDSSRAFDKTRYTAGWLAGEQIAPVSIEQSPETRRYAPTLGLTKLYSGEASFLDSVCGRSFLNLALAVPRRFSDLPSLKTACSSRLGAEPPVSPKYVFGEMLHENSVRELAVFAEFFAPMYDMIDLSEGRPLPGKGDAEVAQKEALSHLAKLVPVCRPKPILGSATRLASEVLLNDAAEYGKIALAQQFALSGAIIAKESSLTLRASTFGLGTEYGGVFEATSQDLLNKWNSILPLSRLQAVGDVTVDGNFVELDTEKLKNGTPKAHPSAGSLRQARSKARDELKDKITDCKVEERWISKHPYQALACALENNPTFANNVLQYVILEQLSHPRPLPAWYEWLREKGYIKGVARQRRTSLQAYDQAVNDDGLWMTTFSGDLPLEYIKASTAAGRSGWFLHLRKQTGEHWFWRLPATASIASGQVYFPLSEGPLRESHKIVLSRLTDYLVGCVSPIRDDPGVATRAALAAQPRRPIPILQ